MGVEGEMRDRALNFSTEMENSQEGQDNGLQTHCQYPGAYQLTLAGDLTRNPIRDRSWGSGPGSNKFPASVIHIPSLFSSQRSSN